MRRAFVLLVLSILALPIVHASAQPTAKPDIVVHGTKTGTPIEQLTGAVTVIDEAAIKEKRVPSVLEVLREVDGLDVVQSGGGGGVWWV
ncbi:MAG TPA: hypothetical protein VFN94_10565, partial [Nitrospiria bacterium]|nr:hypothetical protein [Nitrospiria bacterium]